MASHVSNLATKYEDPTPIRSWVMSYNGSHWLALEMRTRPLRMRRITWPVSRGSKTVTYLESPTPICLSTITTFIGLWRRLRVVYSRAVRCWGRLRAQKKFKSRRNRAQKWQFWGKMWVKTLDFGFATPKRHFLARNRVVWRILRQNWCTRLSFSLSQEPKKLAESL